MIYLTPEHFDPIWQGKRMFFPIPEPHEITHKLKLICERKDGKNTGRELLARVTEYVPMQEINIYADTYLASITELQRYQYNDIYEVLKIEQPQNPEKQ